MTSDDVQTTVGFSANIITSPGQIDLWRDLPEDERVEFKEAKTQFDNHKLFEYCVAIANEGGGHLVLGVGDKPPRPVVGTSAFRDPIGMAPQILQNVHFRVDIEEVLHPDGRVLVFHIPPRPRGTAYSFQGRYLMRCGEALVSMSEDKLRLIFDEGKPSWLQELAVDGAQPNDIIQHLDTQSYFDLIKLPYPPTREGVLERFEREQLITKTSRGYGITNLCAILLAKRLDQFRSVARHAVRIIVYDGDGKLRTKREETIHSGYASSFDGLIKSVEAQTPGNMVVEEALRREVRMYPPIAIREMVAKALIHQDFSVAGASVMIEIYDTRIEVSNPGIPSILPDRFIDEYQSRNEQLADFMRRFGICEEKGSGIDKIVDSAEVFQLPAPQFRVDKVRTTCVLYGHRPFSTMTKADRVRACYQHCCLKYVMREKMSNQTLRKRFGLSNERAETVSRIIRDTVIDGFIKPENALGGRKYATYFPYWA